MNGATAIGPARGPAVGSATRHSRAAVPRPAKETGARRLALSWQHRLRDAQTHLVPLPLVHQSRHAGTRIEPHVVHHDM